MKDPTMLPKPKPRRAPYRGWFQTVATGLILGCFIVWWVTSDVSSVDESSLKRASQVTTRPAVEILRPKVVVIEDVEMFYMFPRDIGVEYSPVGVLLFFHGCSHGGQDMFYLPEDRIVAYKALKLGLVVLSITSQNRMTGCWSFPDLERLESKVVDQWADKVGISNGLPRVAMGASSGGSFVFFSYKAVTAKAISSYISPGVYTDEELTRAKEGQLKLPPVAYVHMTKDHRVAKRVQIGQQELSRAGVVHKVWGIESHPFTPQLCAERIPEMGDAKCQEFIQLVRTKYPKIMDESTMEVLQSYKGNEWKPAMDELNLNEGLVTEGRMRGHDHKFGELSNVAPSGSSWTWAAVEEEIAAAFGVHEMSSEYADEVLDFLLKNAGISTN